MHKKIIGVAGRMGSGKGSVATFLEERYGAKRYRSSTLLRQALDIFGIPQKRENMAELSTFLRHTYGEYTIARAVRAEVEESTADIAIFDGMRRDIDVETFRSMENFSFIFVDVDPQIRYERYITRKENPGDGDMTFEEFCVVDAAEPEQQVEHLKQFADYIIVNNGAREDFVAQMEEILGKIIVAA